MATQAQVFIEKQGSLDKKSWSSRMLTVDTPTGTATVSQNNNVKALYHHSIRVTGLRTFPDVDLAHTKLDRNSVEAKWVMCLIGEKVDAPDFSVDRSTEPPAADSSTTSADSGSKTTNKKQRGFSFGGSHKASGSSETWMIRCLSQDTFDLVSKLLRQMTKEETREPSHPRPGAASG